MKSKKQQFQQREYNMYQPTFRKKKKSCCERFFNIFKWK